MTPPSLHWSAAATCLAVTLVATLAERRRNRRRDLDRVGWVPWELVQIIALLLTVIFAALAFLSR